jgi:hypothetical protein
LDTPENVEVLKEVYKKWKEYQVYMDARPYFPPIDQKRYPVWQYNNGTAAWELINNPSEGQLVLLRYWPRDLLEKTPPEPLTEASWYTASSNARRKADFLAARGKIEAQMAALKASPFWNVAFMEGEDTRYLLREMWQDMKGFISTADIPAADLYKDRDWDRGMGGTDIMSGTSGITEMNGV